MIRERRINIEADDFASLFLYEKQVFAKNVAMENISM